MNTNVLTGKENIVEFAIGLANKWQSKFDIIPPYEFHFEEKDDALYLNGKLLCPASQIDPEACSVDVECITFGLFNGDRVFIHIIWDNKNQVTTHLELVPAGYAVTPLD